MEIKLIAGNRDEKMIDLVKSTVENCQSDEHSSRMFFIDKGEVCEVPHEVGSCRYCRRCNKFDCALMKLCRQYGFDKVYDAVFYAYGGDMQILEKISSFEWETMTREQYSIYLEWLSAGKIMAS